MTHTVTPNIIIYLLKHFLNKLLIFYFLIIHSHSFFFFFFFNDPPPPEIYPLPLHDALPICVPGPLSPHSTNAMALSTTAAIPTDQSNQRGVAVAGASPVPAGFMRPRARSTAPQIGRAHV